MCQNLKIFQIYEAWMISFWDIEMWWELERGGKLGAKCTQIWRTLGASCAQKWSSYRRSPDLVCVSSHCQERADYPVQAQIRTCQNKKNARQYSFLPLRASFVSNYVSKTKHFTTNKLIYLIIRNTEEISPKAIMITSAKELCRFSKLRIKLPCLRRKFKWEVNFSWLSFCVFFGPLQTAYCTNSI